MDRFKEQLDWIASQQAHMAHLVHGWSAINSGSTHVAGLGRMRKVLEDNFFWLKGDMDVIPLPPMEVVSDEGVASTQALGEVIRIRKRRNAPIRLLLVGHYDTVYGENHPFQVPRFLDENTLNGPGVADLKGGLVVMLKALEALEMSPWAEQIGWEVILNPDEEIGSVGSAKILAEGAKWAQVGLIYEPAMADGTLAGARKGSGNFTVTVSGRAAHAGRNPRDGRNAVVAAAQIAQQLYALNEAREGVLVNPARFHGGGALNVVPDRATLKFNLRTSSVADEGWLLSEINRITEPFRGQDGFDCVLHGHFTRAPKPLCGRNEALFQLVRQVGAELGQEIRWKDTGGACDGNNLYSHGLPNVDTLGVIGGNIHSEDEFMRVDSLTSRAQLSALLLMQLASGDKMLERVIKG